MSRSYFLTPERQEAVLTRPLPGPADVTQRSDWCLYCGAFSPCQAPAFERRILAPFLAGLCGTVKEDRSRAEDRPPRWMGCEARCRVGFVSANAALHAKSIVESFGAGLPVWLTSKVRLTGVASGSWHGACALDNEARTFVSMKMEFSHLSDQDVFFVQRGDAPSPL